VTTLDQWDVVMHVGVSYVIYHCMLDNTCIYKCMHAEQFNDILH